MPWPATPVDGWQGRVWRAIGHPVRLLAPVRFAVARVARRRFWTESVLTTPGAGPDLEMQLHHDVQTPDDGAGPLNHRSYSVRIAGATMDAAQLVEMFRLDPNAFCHAHLGIFVPDPAPLGLRVGDEVEVKIPGPWDGPVRVAEATPGRVRLETRDGHMEAGWIVFRAEEIDDLLGFTIESYARSGSLVFNTLYHRFGIAKYMQTEMWVQVLEALQAASGGTQQGRISIQTVIYEGADT